MTKEEIQGNYAKLAANVGDLHMRRQQAAALVKAMDEQMELYYKERHKLEQDLKALEPESESIDQ